MIAAPPMHRRHFLLALTAATFAPRAWSAEAPLQLGFSLYGMKTVPLDEALKTCAEIGYQNVELALNPGYPTEPKLLGATARQELRRTLQERRLEISALMLNMSLAVDDAAHAKNLEAFKEAAQLAHDLAPDRPPLIETVLGGKPPEWDKLKAGMAERLKSWAQAAEAAGVTLAVKAHVGSAVNSPERLKWLLDQAPGKSICAAYDYSHFEVQGIPLEESLRTLLPYTRFIHVKDTTGDAAKFQFLLPGQGRTDYAAYFKLLRRLGYHGPVVVEVSAQVFNKPRYDPIAAARDCYAKLSTALKE
jgi:sugar phosphate isomerase/epimerase